MNLDDIPKLSEIKNLVVLLCMPTNNDGKPSSNTEKFFDWIQEGKSGLDGLKYAVSFLSKLGYIHIPVMPYPL